MTTTDTLDVPLRREDLQMFDLMHGAMRGGSRALSDALAELAPLDRAGARELRDYFAHMHAAIVDHHTVEDEVFFPAMVMKAPHAAAVGDELHGDHERLDDALARLGTALDRLVASGAAEADRRDAAEAADALSLLLDDHLDREEAAVLPAYLAHFTRAEYVAVEAEAGRHAGRIEHAFVGPWILAGATDAEAEWLHARAPKIARWLYRFSWKRRFERAYPRIVGATPSARRPVGAASIAALVVAAVALGLGGCAEDAASRGSHDHSAMQMAGMEMAGSASHGSRPASHRVDVTLDDFSFRTASAGVKPGVTTVKVANVGAEAHQLQIGRPSHRLTAANFADRLERDGESAVLQQVQWVGGPNAVPAGGEEEAVVELAPGDYLMVCFMPSPDGTAHLMKGMVSTLHVEAGVASTTLPKPDETIVVEDFQIALPEGFRGHGLVEMRNEGEQGHEVIFVRANDGSTIADAFAWYASDQTTPPPFTFAGGIGEAEPGHSAYARLDLPPGDYAAVCFLPDLVGDGQPHAKHGMVTQFTVS
jgi:hemerythrin-like domain-containing protein